jgi:3-hydroxyisobutyrate dehydrogenase
MTDAVAVLGAGGTMGLGMARNVARAGIELVAWNRSRAKAEPLARECAQLCDTPAEAAASAALIVTMLSDADAVLATMQGSDGALAGARPNSVWIQMSTIGEQGTARCAELAQEHGIGFVDAPVLGTKQPAQEGKLVVMASGPEALRERVQPVFDAVAQRTMWVGEQAGASTRLKLVTNAWIVSVVEGAAETIALAEGLGLQGSAFFEAIDGGPLDMPYLRLKGGAMLARDFEPTFALELASKDARLAVESAERAGLDLPALKAISARMQEAVPEHGKEDLSVMFFDSRAARLAPAAAP